MHSTCVAMFLKPVCSLHVYCSLKGTYQSGLQERGSKKEKKRQKPSDFGTKSTFPPFLSSSQGIELNPCLELCFSS